VQMLDGAGVLAQNRRMTAEVVLDLKGLKCPLPVLRSRQALKALAPGALLVVEANDPMAVLDIPHMCNEDGHRLVSVERLEDLARFVIARGERS
jgi:tRNA 2-thiouridine synthesizing protein A